MSDLTPDSINDVVADVDTWQQPSYTFRLNYETNGQVNGYCDKLEAVRQAIYKILNTERYQYLIYSWNYGIELADLFGQPIPYVYAEIQRRITEALLQDDRITDVYDFDFSNNSDDVLCKFSVKTRFGEITNLEKGVTGIV